jgi:hypothetical protein
LFVTVRVLLAPKLEEERRHFCKNSDGSMNLRMTARTERDHQVHDRFARYAMVNDYGALLPTRRIAHAAPVTVAF